MNFKQFLAVLRARKWLALLVLATVIGAAAAVTMALPRQYTATASVVVDAKPDPITTMGFPGMALPSFMATQVDILSSERVAGRVVEDLNLASNPALRADWQQATQGRGSFERWIIEAISKGLDVKPSRESNVIWVSYKARDPRFAAALANAFVDAYIKITLDLRASPAQSFRKLFDAQLKEARDNLEKGQNRLSAFQREKGIIATDERLDVENARLNELSSQLTQFQGLAAESSSRLAQVQVERGDRMNEVLGNPVVAALKADVARSEARLGELSARLGSNHPQVVETQANIRELRARLDAETKRAVGSVAVTNSINRGREAQVRQDLQQQREKVLRMKAVRDEGLVLQREVESAQRIYDSLAVRQSQSVLEAQNTQSFANVLSAADEPSEPSSPKTLVNLAVATLLGLLLAIGVVLVRELSDRRVRTLDDVPRVIGLPVLGTLPKPRAKRFVAGARRLALPAHPGPGPLANDGY